MVYASQDGRRIAPVLIARTIDWKPVPLEPPASLPGIGTIIVAIIGIGLVAIAIAALGYYASNRTLSKRREQESFSFDPTQIKQPE